MKIIRNNTKPFKRKKKKKKPFIQKIILDNYVRIGMPFTLEIEIQKNFTILNPEFLKEVKRRRLNKMDWPSCGYLESKQKLNGKWTTNRIYQRYLLWKYDGSELVLPRGSFQQVHAIYRRHSEPCKIVNNRTFLPEIEIPFKSKLMDEKGQLPFIEYKAHNGILISGTGCLIGDTSIRINRLKIGFTLSLETLYQRWHGLHGRKPYKETFTAIRTYQDDINQIRLNQILDVVYSGEKMVYKLILMDGKNVIGTADHKIKTERGWIKLLKLKETDMVMIDQPHQKATGGLQKKKGWYRQIPNLKYHPYADKKKMQRPAHILVFEANLNGLSFQGYINILKNHEKAAKSLLYIDSAIHCIHHKDFDCANNDLANLEKLTKKDHYVLHKNLADKQNKFGVQGVPAFSQVKNIEKIGIRKTYDIQCKAPHHNFAANDIIVHNSGKTVLALFQAHRFKQPTLIVVDTYELQKQWINRITEHCAISKADIGMIGGGKQIIKPITVGLIQTLSKLPELTDHFGFIITDEVHETSDRYYKLMEYYKGAYSIGLTATPKDGPTGRIQQSYFGPIVMRLDKEKAEKLPATGIFVQSDYRSSISFKYKYSTALAAMLADEKRNRLIIATVLRHINIYGIHLVISRSSKQLDALYEMLPDHIKLIARVITGKVSKKARRDIVHKAMKNELKFLFATDKILEKGFDEELLSVYHIASPKASEDKVEQGCGRVRRVPKKEHTEVREKKKHAFIFYYFDNQELSLRGAASAVSRAFVKLGIPKQTYKE